MKGYENLTVDQMKQATEQLKEMQKNNAKYGVYVTNENIPEAQSRQELYERLGSSNVFKEIAEKQKEFQHEINRISRDKRYKDEFKSEYKKKLKEEFIKYKEERLLEVNSKLQGYKDDLKDKYSYKIEDPQLEATQTNNSLLELAFIQQLDNNTELLQNFINNNWHRSQVMSVVENMYKDNATITTQIYTRRKKEQKPFQLVNKCLNDVTTFINNSDYVVNSDYLQAGITKFNPVNGDE